MFIQAYCFLFQIFGHCTYFGPSGPSARHHPRPITPELPPKPPAKASNCKSESHQHIAHVLKLKKSIKNGGRPKRKEEKGKGRKERKKEIKRNEEKEEEEEARREGEKREREREKREESRPHVSLALLACTSSQHASPAVPQASPQLTCCSRAHAVLRQHQACQAVSLSRIRPLRRLSTKHASSPARAPLAPTYLVPSHAPEASASPLACELAQPAYGPTPEATTPAKYNPARQATSCLACSFIRIVPHQHSARLAFVSTHTRGPQAQLAQSPRLCQHPRLKPPDPASPAHQLAALQHRCPMHVHG